MNVKVASIGSNLFYFFNKNYIKVLLFFVEISFEQYITSLPNFSHRVLGGYDDTLVIQSLVSSAAKI